MFIYIGKRCFHWRSCCEEFFSYSLTKLVHFVCRKSSKKPPGAYLQKWILGMGLVWGELISKLCVFLSWIQKILNFINHLGGKITKRLFCKQNLLVNNSFFIITTKIVFHSAFYLQSRDVILYSYCPAGLSWNKILFCTYTYLQKWF